ncbi:MAG: EamA family transporter [Candidatus Cloacimonetes bacterium HGW-Cloacimonetes-1]|jgi:drug/metabolite transporter (DMT)-like permease|nr:MAG: EamA family transporter [Candidatus Cloacimonetes bacterium HGW-Cloacimonetes-1]
MNKSYLYAALAILCWSTVSTAFKLSLGYLTPLGLMSISSLSAMLFLFIVLLFNKSGEKISVASQLKRSLIPGLLNPALYYFMLFEAYNRIKAQEAQVLNYTWAIVLSLFMIAYYKQRFRWSDMAALFISFCGVVVISTHGDFGSLQFDSLSGSILAISSSLVWASYWLINHQDRRPATQKLFFNFVVGSMAIVVFVTIKYLILHTPIVFKANHTNHLYGILGGVYIGIFEMGLTFLLWNKALASTDETSKIANLIFITPFISLIFIKYILLERIHPATLIGLVLIILSNTFQKLWTKSRT